MKNIFVKPNEQSKACINSAMARKGRTKSNIFTLALLLVAVMAASCSGMRKFDRVETTSVERYNIVYKDNKYGLYDIQADSLVTAIKYDALKFAITASEGGYEFTIWVGDTEEYEGMISIESTTNEPMEIMFPKQQGLLMNCR